MDNSFSNNTVKSTPLYNAKSTPIVIDKRKNSPRNYVSSSQIIQLAIDKYKKNGKGLIYRDLMEAGVVSRKKHAQNMLKYYSRKGALFTLRRIIPQQYYASSIRSEVMKSDLSKSTPLHLPAVAFSKVPDRKGPFDNCIEPIIMQTLEGYVLPLLPKAPLFIHNMQFKTKITPECYSELNLPNYKRNNGKYHREIIGNSHVTYVLYANGTVEILTVCSNNPYKLETEDDRDRIIVFFGQIRAGLINLLNDRHERIVPDILEWELPECDINKDIKVSDLFHLTGIKIQVKHLNHLFRIYIKAMGKDTVCRVEENKHPKKRAIEFINDIFNPYERLERQIIEQDKKLTEISEMLKKLAIHRFHIDSS